jgi:phosphoribosylglycinamide formyltransferase-1
MAALLAAAEDPSFPVRVAAVGADRDGAAGLDIAKAHDVPTFTTRFRDHPNRHSWSVALARQVAHYRPTVVLSAGLMRILDPIFLTNCGALVVNSHPSLLPSFAGGHAVRDALAYGVRLTGATIHLLDAGVDTGPIVAQTAVPVLDDDDESSLHERIKEVEREMLVRVIPELATMTVTTDGRKVRLG